MMTGRGGSTRWGRKETRGFFHRCLFSIGHPFKMGEFNLLSKKTLVLEF